MKRTPDGIRLSATDLAHHLSCRHLTTLERAATARELEPPRWRDPALEVLEARGLRHERAYLEHLRAQGAQVIDLRDSSTAGDAAERTRAALRSGVDVIAQATLEHQGWLGRADVLLRVERPSEIGPWSYEVVDTKLARDTRAGTLLQLCLYSELLAVLQGALPLRLHVVPPGAGFERESYQLSELLYYHRRVKLALMQGVDVATRAQTYPEPTQHCEICRWWPRCNAQRHDDDHLSLVAGITRLQAREVARWNVRTLAQLAALPLPLEQRPRRGARAGYERIREQARVQLEARMRQAPVYELLVRVPERGLARLPAPSPGDLFLDFEGDPFAGSGGMEYLIGWCDAAGHYTARWALDGAGERAAFEWLVELLTAQSERFPDAHYYHFAPYEPAALRRLMGRYGTCEVEMDRLLRAERFVDLHAVARQSVRAGVERYSIKDLECFYGYTREVELREASLHLHAIERALELDAVADLPDAVRDVVQGYNRDDCRSALHLRAWLERVRDECVAAGEMIARPAAQSAEPSERISEQQKRIAPVKASLLRDVPAERSARSADQQGVWLLAEMLDWHGREGKAPWWEYFRLRDLGEDDLFEEKSAIAGLEFVERNGGTPQCPVDHYRFPLQNTHVRVGNVLHTNSDETLGDVVAIDLVARTLAVKKRKAARDAHPTAVFEHDIVLPGQRPEALLALGEWVAAHGIDAPGPLRAARDLLLARPPRLHSGAELQRADDDALAAARRLALELDHGVLPIQGPPGSGKTCTGARMIVTLVRAGKHVGVSAVSHKVINNLLRAAHEVAQAEGVAMQCVHKVNEDDASRNTPGVRELRDNAAARAAIAGDAATVCGGTAWLWSREDFVEAVDVLFIDEAGQMALADVLACARCARNLVLLGDPLQLEQPQQGSHPEGTNVSALEHLLGGALTMAPGRGLFLAETWRLNPALCAFTSELFYEQRLEARPGLDAQVIAGASPLAGAGLWYSPVAHDGNQSAAPEEVERVAALVQTLLREGTAWIDAKCRRHPLTRQDILIVAPYNAQVGEISRALPQARVGTVDKFQGQEAAVVIYSMATSAPEDAPRGMEFLYSANRLNVATSRARCACILVASPRLFEPECRTPAQIRLANAFCRYLELARTITPGSASESGARGDWRVAQPAAGS
jgi:uncharacterized protein